jgi:hypothetical protein
VSTLYGLTQPTWGIIMKKSGKHQRRPSAARTFTAVRLHNPRKCISAMPFVPYPALQVNVIGSYFGQLVENVWHCLVVGPTPPLGDLASVAAAFQTGYAAMQIPLSDQYFVSQIDVQFLGLITGPQFTLFITPPQSGGNASPGMPGSVAFCVRLRTGAPGRSFRGRKYFTGLCEGTVTDNLFDATTADTIVSAINSMQTALTALNYPLAILSKTALAVTEVVNVGYYDLVVDSQRRRLPGRGR